MVTSATDNFVILTGLARLRLSPSVTDPPWPEKRPACPEAAQTDHAGAVRATFPNNQQPREKGSTLEKGTNATSLIFFAWHQDLWAPRHRWPASAPRDSKRLRGACPARRTSASPLAGSRHLGRCGVPEAACSARAPIRTWPAIASLREKWT